jgi:hypothetical protein
MEAKKIAHGRMSSRLDDLCICTHRLLRCIAKPLVPTVLVGLRIARARSERDVVLY